MNRKTKIASAIGLVLSGAASYSGVANANLTSSATLSFTLGQSTVVSCRYGTTPPCNNEAYNVTDIVGSYFAWDLNDNGFFGANEKMPISSFNGIHIGGTQPASGSHAGSINGTESPNIDNPWTWLGGTGMHQTTSPITVLTDSGTTKTLDMSGWNVTWNGIPSIPMVQVGNATITCSSSSCSDSSNYTLDALFHANGAGFTSAPYAVHLTGHVTSTGAVPVPAAAWLFGSGLMGLAGVARRRKSQ